ncbi:hypothetical protein F5B22DRAFT_189947 [Xylaria bambusicola]|uniref:uncharacterized protein n=1 Tax=Xylaria bambusicola TaxID=326684 RepID=UPI002008DC13|nr:uncharacterized protein F5B22DRAFT_189947 [Xylaria bambusicola]KAI0515427.1 hypothetical protein F5B22DRAFT_189947 [Xylaria bambusicola]
MDQVAYLGLWTNWSRGSVLGLTFTTTRERGNLLIAFTAFFISFIATRVWKIVCLILHRSYSTSNPSDAVHHQQQVILRNSSSPESGLLSLIRLSNAYKSSLKGRLLRQLTPILLAILVLVGFSIAGGFSSSISSSVRDEVLTKSTNCGIVGPSTTSVTDLAIWTAHGSKLLNDAIQYAQNCYTEASAGKPECQKYVVNKIPTNMTDTSAPCPFDEKMCRTTENIRLDTGYINSHHLIGLDAPKSERFAWRYVLQCAPLRTDGYTSKVTIGNKTEVRYHYGATSYGQYGSPTEDPVTFSVGDINEQYPKDKGKNQESKQYTIIGKTYKDLGGKPAGGSRLQPIPELLRSDGDIIVIFLVGNGVVLFEPTDDEWYRATETDGTLGNPDVPGSAPAYRPNEPASPMGCVEQWQWCNLALPEGEDCGPLSSIANALNGAAPFFNLTIQDLEAERPISSTAVGTRLLWPMQTLLSISPDIETLFAILGPRALASSDRFLSGIQWPISKNQWQEDVTYWFSVMLSQFQSAFVETASSNTDPQLDHLRLKPRNEEEEKMCHRQKIRTTSYTSFNVFGLYFTYITGAVIAAISYSLESIFQCLHRRRKYHQYAHLEWVTNEQLQLHRLAHEPNGDSTWHGCAEEVPTTDPGVQLPPLDISDPEHPVFYGMREKQPVPVLTTTEVGSSDDDADSNSLNPEQVLAETTHENNATSPEEQVDRSSTETQASGGLGLPAGPSSGIATNHSQHLRPSSTF